MALNVTIGSTTIAAKTLIVTEGGQLVVLRDTTSSASSTGHAGQIITYPEIPGTITITKQAQT